MQEASAKPVRTARELHAELDWAARILSGDDSSSRVMFELPTPAASGDPQALYNWDVEVSCRPDQDETAQAAVQYVADKWNLVIAKPENRPARAAALRADSADAIHYPAAESSRA